MENTNEVVMENEQEVEVEVIKKEGIFKKIGNKVKETGKAIKRHPFKASGIVLATGTAIVGTVLVIKKVIDAKNDVSEGIEVVDTIEELAEKVKEQIGTSNTDIPFEEAAETLSEITEGVTE